jgi:hypothetical protein
MALIFGIIPRRTSHFHVSLLAKQVHVVFSKLHQILVLFTSRSLIRGDFELSE